MKKTIFIFGILVIAFLAVGGVWLYAQQTPHAGPIVRTSQSSVEQESSTVQQGPISNSSTFAATLAATATPTVGMPVAAPSIIVVNTSTPVTVTVQIPNATLIPGSVNLLRLGATGTQPTILGVMQNAGNGMYTLQPTFDETRTGQIQLEVSAAFQGILRRVLSTVLEIPVWDTVSPRGLFTMVLPGNFQVTDMSTTNAYDTNVFLVQLNSGNKVGYIYVFTSQQWMNAEQADEHPTLLLQTGGFVYAYTISQALYPDQQDRINLLTAVKSIQPL